MLRARFCFATRLQQQGQQNPFLRLAPRYNAPCCNFGAGTRSSAHRLLLVTVHTSVCPDSPRVHADGALPGSGGHLRAAERSSGMRSRAGRQRRSRLCLYNPEIPRSPRRACRCLRASQECHTEISVLRGEPRSSSPRGFIPPPSAPRAQSLGPPGCRPPSASRGESGWLCVTEAL